MAEEQEQTPITKIIQTQPPLATFTLLAQSAKEQQKQASPEGEASFLGFNTEDLKQKVEQDVARQNEVVLPPSLDEFLALDNPLEDYDYSPVFKANINNTRIKNAKTYIAALNQPNVDKAKLDKSPLKVDYNFVSSFLGSEKQNALNQIQGRGPAIAFTNRENDYKVNPDSEERIYGLFTNPEGHYADNRVRLLDFASSRLNMGNKPEVLEVLLKHHSTGDMMVEMARRVQDSLVGIGSLAYMLYSNGQDYLRGVGKSIINEDGNIDLDLSQLSKHVANNKNNRQANRRAFLLRLDENTGVLQEHTEKMNEFIKEKYIEDNGQQAYDDLIETKGKDALTLSADDARALYDFSFNELSGLETVGTLIGENVGTNVIFTTAGKVIALPFRVLSKGRVFKTDLEYYLRQDIKRKTFENNGVLVYKNTTTADFAQEMLRISNNKNRFMKMINGLTLKSKRLQTNLETGFFKHKAMNEDSSMQTVLKELDNEVVRYHKILATSGSSSFPKQFLLDKAEQDIQRAVDNVLKQNAFALSRGSLVLPSQQLIAMGVDEVIPSVAQAMAYKFLAPDNNDPEGMANADFYSTGAYMATLLGFGKPGKFVFKKAIGGLDSVLLGNTLEDMTFLMSKFIGQNAIGARLLNLDTDLLNEKIFDPNIGSKGEYRELTPQEFATLSAQKQRLLRLDPESRSQLLEAKGKINEKITAIGSIFTDPATRKIVEEQLALSFAQSSGMTYFLALAQKSATNLGLKDVTKVTQKFAQTNKYLTDLNKTMETQARVVQELQDIFALAKSKGQVDPTKEGAFLNQLRLEGTISAGIKAQQAAFQAVQANGLKNIEDLLKSPDIFSKRPEELDQILEDLTLVETQKLATVPPTTAGFFQKQQAAIKRVQELHSKALEGINTATNQMYNLDVDPANAQKIATSVGNTLRDNQQNKLSIIYAPTKQLGKVKATNLISKVVEAHSKNSFYNGAADNILAHLQPNSAFAKDAVGRKIISSVNEVADNALQAGFEAMSDPTLGIKQRKIQATTNKKTFYQAIENYVLNDLGQTPEALFGKGAISDVTPIQIYKFVVDNQKELAPKIDAIFDYKGMINMEVEWEDVERLRRFARDQKNKYENKSPSAYEGFQNLESDIDSFITNFGNEKIVIDGRETTVADELGYYATKARIEVYGNEKGNSLLKDISDIVNENYDAKNLESLLTTATGQHLLKGMFSENRGERLKSAELFKEAIIRSFGTAKYPKQITTDAGEVIKITDDNGDLLRQNYFKKVTIGGKEVALNDHLAKGIDREGKRIVEYVLDPTSDNGKAGMAMADQVVKLMLKGLPAYRRVFSEGGLLQKAFKGREIFKVDALGETDALTASFLTAPDGKGKEYYDALQDMLTITGTDGNKYTITNIDSVVGKMEADFFDIITTSKNQRQQILKEVESMNRDAKDQITSGVIENNRQADLDFFVLKSLNINNPKEMVLKYLDTVPRGMQRQGADVMILKTLQSDKKFIMDQTKGKYTEEQINAYFASMLHKGMEQLGSTGFVKSAEGKGYSSIPDNPFQALEYLETDTARALFKEVGVDDTHYEAFRGIMSHIAITREAARRQGVGLSLPEVDYTDTGIMSRAFNYARGLVSAEYLLVEAGFRMMRDNDVKVMSWLLNDKKAAEIMYRMIDPKAEPIQTEDAKVFFTQMRAFIIRHAAKNQTEIDLEIMDRFEEIQQEVKEQQDAKNIMRNVPKFEDIIQQQYDSINNDYSTISMRKEI